MKNAPGHEDHQKRLSPRKKTHSSTEKHPPQQLLGFHSCSWTSCALHETSETSAVVLPTRLTRASQRETEKVAAPKRLMHWIRIDKAPQFYNEKVAIPWFSSRIPCIWRNFHGLSPAFLACCLSCQCSCRAMLTCVGLLRGGTWKCWVVKW